MLRRQGQSTKPLQSMEKMLCHLLVPGTSTHGGPPNRIRTPDCRGRRGKIPSSIDCMTTRLATRTSKRHRQPTRRGGLWRYRRRDTGEGWRSCRLLLLLLLLRLLPPLLWLLHSRQLVAGMLLLPEHPWKQQQEPPPMLPPEHPEEDRWEPLNIVCNGLPLLQAAAAAAAAAAVVVTAAAALEALERSERSNNVNLYRLNLPAPAEETTTEEEQTQEEEETLALALVATGCCTRTRYRSARRSS